MTSSPLQGRRILAVEDEYYLAMDLARELDDAGAVVLGPVPSIDKALSLISAEPAIDLALLDVNLSGEMAYPVADALISRDIPFVFTTGYADGDLGERYPHVQRCEKPFELRKLMATLASTLGSR